MSSPTNLAEAKGVVPPLVEILADIPDFRQSRGKRHPLLAILTLACVAMLCGYRSPTAIAEWGHNYGSGWLCLMGFRRGKAPSPSTMLRVFRGIDTEQLEERLTQWAEEVLQLLEPPSPGELEPIE